MKRSLLTTIFVLAVSASCCLLPAVMGGCSGLSAAGDMKSEINSAVLVTKASLSSDTPLVELRENAEIFTRPASAATVNIFAHLFGGKQICCSAEIYDLLRQKEWRAEELARRAAAGTLSDENAALATQIEYQWALNTQSQLNGTAPVTTVFSVAEITVTAKHFPRPRARSETLQAIIDSVSNQQAKAWLEEYGESLLALGADEANRLISLLLEGDVETPTKSALSAMSENALMIDAAALLTKDIAATQSNYEKIQTQKAAAKAILTLGLSALAAFLGV